MEQTACVPLCNAGDRSSWWKHAALCPARKHLRQQPPAEPVSRQIIDVSEVKGMPRF